MIDKRELRIGNLVFAETKGGTRQTGCVDTLNSVEATVLIERLEFHVIVYDALSPIPLTEDWLIRLGFVSSPMRNINGNGFKKRSVFIIPVIQEGDIFFMCIIEDEGDEVGLPAVLRSVHQLQNLYYAITGEELKVEL